VQAPPILAGAGCALLPDAIVVGTQRALPYRSVRKCGLEEIFRRLHRSTDAHPHTALPVAMTIRDAAVTRFPRPAAG
jgi:hypothetical protein